MTQDEDIRAESEGVIGIEARVARPERGAARLVESVCVGVRTVSLCDKKDFKLMDMRGRVPEHTEVVVELHTRRGARRSSVVAAGATVRRIG